MGKWQEGSITQASQFKKNNSAPLDDRDVVVNKADLITSSVWTVSGTDTRYRGMIVYARSEDKHYVLIRDNDWDASDYSAWREIGSGGGGAGGNTENYNPYNSPVYQFYSIPGNVIAEGGYRKTSLVTTGSVGTSFKSGLRIVTFTASGTSPCILTTDTTYTASGAAVVAINWNDFKTAIQNVTSVCLNLKGDTATSNIYNPSTGTLLTPAQIIAYENALPSNVIPLYVVFQKRSGSGTSNQRFYPKYFVTATMNKLYLNSNDGYYYSDGGNVSDFAAPPTVNNKTITIKVGDTTAGEFTLNQAADQTITINVGAEDLFVFYKYNGAQTTKTMIVKSES
jgi:hypothetical protein